MHRLTTTKTTTTTAVAPSTTLTRHLFYSTFHSFTQTHRCCDKARNQLFVYMQTIFHAHVHHISKCCCFFFALCRSILAISASDAFCMTRFDDECKCKYKYSRKYPQCYFRSRLKLKLNQITKETMLEVYSSFQKWNRLCEQNQPELGSLRIYGKNLIFQENSIWIFAIYGISVSAFSTNFRNYFHPNGRFKMQWCWWR